MNTSANFRVLKPDLQRILKSLLRIETAAKKKKTTLEVTIIDDTVQFTVPGTQLNLHAATKGSAKFTTSLWYFTDIVKSEQDSALHFDLTENRLHLRTLSFPVITTFFESDKILRSINLPINYTDKDLATLLLSGKYTDEEISFNNLTADIDSAIRKVRADIGKATTQMKKFGFNKKEVETLILNKLNEK